jgi:hypothetical protein
MGEEPISVARWQETCPWADATAKMVPGDAHAQPELFINDTDVPMKIRLEGHYRDLDGHTVTETVELAPFTGRVLFKTAQDPAAGGGPTPSGG